MESLLNLSSRLEGLLALQRMENRVLAIKASHVTDRPPTREPFNVDPLLRKSSSPV